MSLTDKLETAKSASSGALAKRIVTALVLMPVVVSAVFAGGPVFAAMVAFAAIVMLFEWTRMVERKSFSNAFYALALFAAAALYFAAAGREPAAFAVCAAAAPVAAFLAGRGGAPGFWPGLGAIYIIAPCAALVWLRLHAPDGLALTAILYAVVWAADTGAFIFGKFIGGPKISYALSPSKTWAGIGGGVLGGCLAGAAAGALEFGLAAGLLYFFVGGALGAASVAGDLVESAFKRNFGLKDISGFVPGHGGALDRLDGMIFATTAMTAGLSLYMLAQGLKG